MAILDFKGLIFFFLAAQAFGDSKTPTNSTLLDAIKMAIRITCEKITTFPAHYQPICIKQGSEFLSKQDTTALTQETAYLLKVITLDETCQEGYRTQIRYIVQNECYSAASFYGLGASKRLINLNCFTKKRKYLPDVKMKPSESYECFRNAFWDEKAWAQRGVKPEAKATVAPELGKTREDPPPLLEVETRVFFDSF